MDPWRPLELHRLPADAAMQRDPVDAGRVRSITHGPLSVEQVLGRGLAQMLDEDEAEERARDPLLWLRGERARPRSLFWRLFGRR